ncbi:MAG TPA: glycoside hydrolase family 3 N-terminal domain-containing protein [Acidimicrobiales bacterium]|nr:glycoside hydrolase family 3 N-terminal domain-containing protein [Acidimicrobiales bacterium]
MALAAAACGGGPPARPPTAGPTPSTTSTSRTPPGAASAPTSPPGCIDLGRWTTAQLARQLITVPSLDFDLPQLGGVVATGVGGVLFLGSAPAPADLGALVHQVNGRSPAGVPLLVMADEEGGGVQRLRPLVEDIPWPRDTTTALTPAQVSSLAARVGSEMRAAGVNMDLAPVLDVDSGAGPSASDPDGRRSYSGIPGRAATYGQAFSAGLQRAGVIPVIKHFPGLGGASGNTDTGPASTQPISALRAAGLQPFRAAITAGAPAVMVANASVPGLTTQPASVSSTVIQGLLRGELRFRGLVITDSLSAGAIRAAGYDVPGAATAAVEAGADIVLFGSTLTAADVAQLRPAAVVATVDQTSRAMTAAVGTGKLPASRLRDAARRVLELRGAAVCEA